MARSQCTGAGVLEAVRSAVANLERSEDSEFHASAIVTGP